MDQKQESVSAATDVKEPTHIFFDKRRTPTGTSGVVVFVSLVGA